MVNRIVKATIGMGTLRGCPQVGPSGSLHGLVAGVPGVQHRRENEGVLKQDYVAIILSTMAVL